MQPKMNHLICLRLIIILEVNIEMSFCPKCGKKLEDGTKFCPECGTAITNSSNKSENNLTNNKLQVGFIPQYNKLFDLLSLIFACASIIFGTIFAIIFGIAFSIFAILLSMAGLVLSISVRKATNNQKGSLQFWLSLAGAAVAFTMLMGCVAYCACRPYGCLGVVGRSCYIRNCGFL